MPVEGDEIDLRTIEALGEDRVIAHHRNTARLEILNASHSFGILHVTTNDASWNAALPQQSGSLCAVVDGPAVGNRLCELVRGNPLCAILRRPSAMRFRDGNLGNGRAKEPFHSQAVNVRPVNQIRKPAVTQSDPINAVWGGRQGNDLRASVGLH